MNSFPEVPMDESLFESNSMMREYWERSTENRQAFAFSDAPMPEERLDDDDVIAEIADVSEKPAEDVEVVAPPVAKPVVDGLVKEKAVSTEKVIVYIALGLLFAFAAYMLFIRKERRMKDLMY